jgi:hypothetical protein
MDKSAIQKELDELFSSENEENERAYELYVTQSERFKLAINTARARLGIENVRVPFGFEEDYIDDWIVANVKSADPAHTYQKAIEKVLTDTGLPLKWRNYIKIYLITGMSPSSNVFPSTSYIEVLEINEKNTTLSIKSGIRYEEYIAAWKVLSKVLGKARRKVKKRDEDKTVRDLQMYHLRGVYSKSKHKDYVTQKALAERYINASINIDDAKDTVKKALKRQRKLHDKGIDLAE